MLNRVRALIVKETLAVLRDARNRPALTSADAVCIYCDLRSEEHQSGCPERRLWTNFLGTDPAVRRFREFPEYSVCQLYGCSSRSYRPAEGDRRGSLSIRFLPIVLRGSVSLDRDLAGREKIECRSDRTGLYHIDHRSI